MNPLIFVTLLFGAACAAGTDKDAPIVSQVLDVGLEGNFVNKWTGNGISIEEVGSSQLVDNKEVAQTIRGQYEYKTPEGTVIKTTYVADKDGARFEGAHLPVAPPPQEIPAYITRALEWAAAHPYDEAAELKKTY